VKDETMTRKNDTRSFVEKVASDNRAYVESLLDENRRLNLHIAELENERDRARQALERALDDLQSRQQLEASLKERVARIEQESRRASQRYVEVEQQNTNLANLYVASYQLHGTLDRQAVLAAIQEIVINLIGSEELGVWELDDESDELRLVASFGIDADAWTSIALGSGVIGSCAVTGERFVAGPNAKKPISLERTLTACIPLRLDDRVIGVIGIFRLLQQKPTLEPVDYELFDLLALHAASALFCTRLLARATAAA
jgi:GAF domain-containing protein